MEVSVNGEWGTVCAVDPDLTPKDFDVVCRQLGYNGALSTNALFSAPSQIVTAKMHNFYTFSYLHYNSFWRGDRNAVVSEFQLCRERGKCVGLSS